MRLNKRCLHGALAAFIAAYLTGGGIVDWEVRKTNY